MCLGTETVEGTAGTLESIDNIEGSDGLALGVFSVSDLEGQLVRDATHNVSCKTYRITDDLGVRG